MDLYEHQGKELFARHGIPLAESVVAESAQEARRRPGQGRGHRAGALAG